MVMNLHELKDALDKAGVLPNVYCLTGGSHP